MLFNNILQHIPNFRLETLYHLLRVLDIVCGSVGDKLFHNKRLEQLNRHLLRKAALVNLQFRSNYDNGTSRIVNSFTQKVLAETALFTL